MAPSNGPAFNVHPNTLPSWDVQIGDNALASGVFVGGVKVLPRRITDRAGLHERLFQAAVPCQTVELVVYL